ncbi:MAG: zinc ribbon domain-containing protein [Ruminococcus sp.]|nr:zinc ribbon domain-containing protein [Ruminococcus sp.]MBQ4238634.1 zinc ribbon domain-containing protein [Ruminococcus sp.]
MNDRDIILESIQMLKALKIAESEQKEQFECPLCGGTVKWYRNENNNHIHLTCGLCGFKIYE